MGGIRRALALVTTMATCATAFYLPGISPHDFELGEQVLVKVNSMGSTLTQLPYEYYSMPYCVPDEGVQMMAENLGEYLTGNRIENSPYQVFMREEAFCQVLCRKIYKPKEIALFRTKIAEGYFNNWIIDNLPAATEVDNIDSKTFQTLYNRGFSVGKAIKNEAGQIVQIFLHNHVTLNISYHIADMEQPDKSRIVNFVVQPFSVKHTYDGNWVDFETKLTSCNSAEGMDPLKSLAPVLDITSSGATEVIWSYDVLWSESDIRWSSRWDIYLNMNNMYNDEVHWFSIVNAVLILFFLTGMVAMILVRTLYRDINRYNAVRTQDEIESDREETGWKLVHADVFRAPTFMPTTFCTFVGTGVQLAIMSLFALFFAAAGFLSPANRGSMMVAILLLYSLMGVLAGYHAARTCKMFRGQQWQRTTVMTAFLYPGCCFAIFFVLDLLEVSYGSSAAVPFSSMVAVLALWFGVSIPLVFFGAYLGFQRDIPTFPVVTSNIPRPIPEQPWYMGTFFIAMLGGVLPFGAVFVELFFILSSLWLNQYYYVFGFLLLVYGILVLTCAEITVVLCYFQLCSEDYNWWWRSFLTSGSSAVYVFIYSAIYFFTKLPLISFYSGVLYFGYMGIISFGFFLFTGTIGYLSCFHFNQIIYASIKVD